MTELSMPTGASDARVLATVGAGTALTLVAFTMVVTTVPETVATFGAGLSWQTWALSGMSLGLAAGLLSAGSVADILGDRRVFMAANLALGASAALAALAPSMLVFVVARVLQGIAGAGVLATGLGLLGRHFEPGPTRTRATGLWGASLGAGIALGPVLGAALAQASDWRAPYALTALAAVGVMVASRGLDPTPPRIDRRPLDPVGALLMALAMGSLTAGLTAGRSSWTSLTTLSLLAGGAVALLAFAVAEDRRTHPMLDLAHLRNPVFLTSIGGAAVTGLATIALMSYMPVMLQVGLGETALASGAVLAIWSATSTLVAAQARRLPEALGSAERLLAGMLASAVGLGALAILEPGTRWWAFAPGLAVAGIGSGLGNAALARLAVESVPGEQAALGSGANNTARYLGSALGIAIVVAVIAGGGSGAAGLAAGWNHAAVLAAAINLAGCALAARLIWGRRRLTATP